MMPGIFKMFEDRTGWRVCWRCNGTGNVGLRAEDGALPECDKCGGKGSIPPRTNAAFDALMARREEKQKTALLRRRNAEELRDQAAAADRDALAADAAIAQIDAALSILGPEPSKAAA